MAADTPDRVTIRQFLSDFYGIAPADVTSDHMDPLVMFLNDTFGDSAPVDGGAWILDAEAQQAGLGFLEATSEEGVEAPDDPWERFIGWAKAFYAAPVFDRTERDYKLNIGEHLQNARAAVVASSEDWATLVRRAFAAPNNLTHYITHGKYLDWLENNRDAARQALLTLWDANKTIGERIAVFSASLPAGLLPSIGARLQISSFLLMADPLEYMIYRPSPFKTAVELVEFEPFPEGPEAAIYEHALAFVDAVLQQAHDRGLALRDRLDAQSVIWSVVKNPPHESGMSSEQAEALERYRGTAPAVWWVNQGLSWQTEQEHGIVTAPFKNRAGHVLQHHKNVSRLRKGDVVLHHWSGAIRAISRVEAKPTAAREPWDPNGEVKRMTKTVYFALADPVFVHEIPAESRVREPGPFDRLGAVKQVYLVPVSVDFSESLRTQFRDRWPAESPWGATQRTTWLFQANPEVWPLAERVAQMDLEDENAFTVSRYKTEIGKGDRLLLWQAGDNAGLYGIGTIAGAVFERSEDDEHYTADEDEHAVPWRLERKLAKPVLRKTLLDHPVLKGLSVITAPQGSNFKVTVEQWTELEKLIDPPKKASVAPRPAATFDEIATYLASQGMSISHRTLRRFHVALRTRGFVILSGISGTGKTWLTELYASAVGAEYHLEPVAPNWTTNEDLLGYHNPIDHSYHDTPFSLFLRASAKEFAEATAKQREPQKYLLALDEMNLARVEYYFARFLSLMEVRARRGSVDVPLGPNESVTVGSNLLFVGTVNVDETTHGFADKVFDRAQLVELDAPRSAIAEHIGTSAFAEALLEVYDAVSGARPFAFRVVEDIKLYIGESEGLGVTWSEALDEQVLQKVLPKLSGAEPPIGTALDKTVGVATSRGFQLTLAKAQRMLEDFNRDGFTSYF